MALVSSGLLAGSAVILVCVAVTQGPAHAKSALESSPWYGGGSARGVLAGARRDGYEAGVRDAKAELHRLADLRALGGSWGGQGPAPSPRLGAMRGAAGLSEGLSEGQRALLRAMAAGRARVKTQSLDGSGSGCGPMGNSCSGSVDAITGETAPSREVGFVLGTSPEAKDKQKTDRVGGFFGNKESLPSTRGMAMAPFRAGSQQNVHYDVPTHYAGYSDTGEHHGLFKFYGAPDRGGSASAMLGSNPDVAVQPEHRRHAFGSDDTQAAAMLGSSGGGLGFYGSHHTMSWGHSIVETNAMPEQLPIHVSSGGGGGSEAAGIMGHFESGQNLADATDLQKSGQANDVTEAGYITAHRASYNHDAPATGHPYGVSYASQTLRENGMDGFHTSPFGQSSKAARNYNKSLKRFNEAAMTSTAYAMTAGTASTGSRIVGRPYHPAKVHFCSLHPDKCFFSPDPATQSVEGVYHSI